MQSQSRPEQTKRLAADLKKKWDLVIVKGKVLGSTESEQTKIIGKLGVVEQLGPHAIVCLRCYARFTHTRRATDAEQEAFNVQEIPEYSGGLLVGPKMVLGKLTTEAFRCSCVVGGTLSPVISPYDSQPEAKAGTTQFELTAMIQKLQGELQAKET